MIRHFLHRIQTNRFFKSKIGQNTAEYALLIALVVAGIIAMQTYAQRSMQARVRGASLYLTNSTAASAIGNTVQYEPYYLESSYNSTRDTDEGKILGAGVVAQFSNTNRTRENGYQESTYNPNEVGEAAMPGGI